MENFNDFLTRVYTKGMEMYPLTEEAKQSPYASQLAEIRNLLALSYAASIGSTEAYLCKNRKEARAIAKSWNEYTREIEVLWAQLKPCGVVWPEEWRS